MFIKTNGWLPNRDYADGQNRPADDIVILQGIAHQQNSQIRPGPSSHRNLLQRDDPTSGKPNSAVGNHGSQNLSLFLC